VKVAAEPVEGLLIHGAVESEPAGALAAPGADELLAFEVIVGGGEVVLRGLGTVLLRDPEHARLYARRSCKLSMMKSSGVGSLASCPRPNARIPPLQRQPRVTPLSVPSPQRKAGTEPLALEPVVSVRRSSTCCSGHLGG